MSLFAGVRIWDLVIVVVVMSILATFELLGVFSTRMITITAITKALLPMPLRFMVFAWLGWHFIVSDLIRQIQGKP